MSSRRVAMLSLSYRSRALILSLKISACCTILLDMRVTMPWRLANAPNYLPSCWSLRCRPRRDSTVERVLLMSEQDFTRRSQFPKRTSSCLLSRSYCASMSATKEEVAVQNLSAGAVGGMVMVLLVRTTSARNLGRGTASQASNFLRNSSLEYSLLARPQKKRTTSHCFSSSLRSSRKRMNYYTIPLQRESVSGSFPYELPSHPSDSRWGTRRKGYSLLRMARILTKSENLRWMVCWQGERVIWQRVQSPCRKFLATCSVLLTVTSWMLGKGSSGFYLAVAMTMLERLIAEVSVLLFSPFFSILTCYFRETSFYPWVGMAGAEVVGFCMVLGGDKGESFDAGSTFYCMGSKRGKLKAMLKGWFC